MRKVRASFCIFQSITLAETCDLVIVELWALQFLQLQVAQVSVNPYSITTMSMNRRFNSGAIHARALTSAVLRLCLISGLWSAVARLCMSHVLDSTTYQILRNVSGSFIESFKIFLGPCAHLRLIYKSEDLNTETR